jgi:hypothetical protein
MNEFTVTKKAERPAFPDDGKCFYCKRLVGESHNTEGGGCPMVKQRIIARISFEYETWMPAERTPEEYFHQRNHGSNCLDNDFDDAMEQLDRFREAAGCVCGFVTVEHVRNVEKPYLDE